MLRVAIVGTGGIARQHMKSYLTLKGRSYWGAGHKACIADFYRSIETGTPYPNAPASCEATMQTLLKLYAQCGEI